MEDFTFLQTVVEKPRVSPNWSHPILLSCG